MTEHIEYAREQLRNARQLWDKAADEVLTAGNSHTNTIIDCQQSIEISVKAMFHAVGEDPPKNHDISFQNAYALLHADFPEHFSQAQSIPRAVFLTQFWNEFYTIAKYGNEDNLIPANQLFDEDEAKLAVDHAQFCVTTAGALLNSVEQEMGQ